MGFCDLSVFLPQKDEDLDELLLLSWNSVWLSSYNHNLNLTVTEEEQSWSRILNLPHVLKFAINFILIL